MKKLSVLVLVSVFLFGCDPNFREQGYEAAPVLPDSDSEFPYPPGPYGYKPSIWENLTDDLMMSDGDTWPDFSVLSLGGYPIIGTNLFNSSAGLLVAIMSTVNCPPCEEEYFSLDEIKSYYELHGFNNTEIIIIVGGADISYIQELYKDFGGLFLSDSDHSVTKTWESDVWPGEIRGYPTTIFIERNSMKIMTENLGFAQGTEWLEEQLIKIHEYFKIGS